MTALTTQLWYQIYRVRLLVSVDVACLAFLLDEVSLTIISPSSADGLDIRYSTERYLLPHEQEVITVRKHPALLVPPAVVLVSDLVIVILFSIGVLAVGSIYVIIAWAALAPLFVYVLIAVARWYVTYLVITERRLIYVRGVETRKVGMLALQNAERMTFSRSILGRLFGYGTFIINPVGQIQRLRKITYLPYPEQLYLEVCSLLFPDDSDQYLEY